MSKNTRLGICFIISLVFLGCGTAFAKRTVYSTRVMFNNTTSIPMFAHCMSIYGHSFKFEMLPLQANSLTYNALKFNGKKKNGIVCIVRRQDDMHDCNKLAFNLSKIPGQIIYTINGDVSQGKHLTVSNSAVDQSTVDLKYLQQSGACSIMW